MPARFFNGKNIAVTGACGTVGRELVAQLLQGDVAEIRALDSSENALHDIELTYKHDPRLKPYYCDVRIEPHLTDMLEGVDYVFHAAAMKHVPACENSPGEAIQTNILGIQNLIRAARKNKVKRVLFTSSDKAVNPTSVMGTSKLMGEKLLTAANNHLNGTLFVSTRFGNVLGSKGSVVPIFCDQIAAGGPVTVTDGSMTRFIMDLPEAVSLVIHSMTMAQGGEVFVTKMPVITIQQLAETMVEMLAPLFGHNPKNIPIQYVGHRPGEKVYEELTSDEEKRRTLDLDKYFAILPALTLNTEKGNRTYPGFDAKPADRVYISANEELLSQDALRSFLLRPTVLPEELRKQLVTEDAPASHAAAA